MFPRTLKSAGAEPAQQTSTSDLDTLSQSSRETTTSSRAKSGVLKTTKRKLKPPLNPESKGGEEKSASSSSLKAKPGVGELEKGSGPSLGTATTSALVSPKPSPNVGRKPTTQPRDSGKITTKVENADGKEEGSGGARDTEIIGTPVELDFSSLTQEQAFEEYKQRAGQSLHQILQDNKASLRELASQVP